MLECGAGMTKEKGVTIVELMVALALGLFLLGGVITIYVSSRQAYRTSDALTRVQDNGRFAMELISRDLRRVGYKGKCLNDVNVLLNTAHADYRADLFDLDNAITGWENASGAYADGMKDYRPQTDVMFLKHAANATGATARGVTPPDAAAIVLDEGGDVEQGEIVVVSDALGCDMFQNVAAANAGALNRAHGGKFAPGNRIPATAQFSHQYDQRMEILTLSSSVYYIGKASGNADPASFALKRLTYGRGTAPEDVELIEGVLDLQVRYGIDTNTDRQVDRYVMAKDVPQWGQVVSAQVCIVAASTEPNVAPEAMSVSCHGERIAIPDRRLGQAFTATIALRNRLP